VTPPRKPQVRLRYSKLGKLRFTSHRDMARIWERSVRRLQLPIAYSEGFSPRAKLSFGLALPTVFESQAEFVDLTFNEPVEIGTMPEQLTEVLPQGITVTGAVALEGKVASLQESVEATSWSLFVDGDHDELQAWSGDLLAADELLVTRERKGKSSTDDVRSAVLAVEVRPNADTDVPAAVEIYAELATKPRALRPLELLDIKSPNLTLKRGRRLNQFVTPVGARLDPLEVGAAEALLDAEIAS
jgi:radical SAM-linked protein